jgi:hypothetical protein
MVIKVATRDLPNSNGKPSADTRTENSSVPVPIDKISSNLRQGSSSGGVGGFAAAANPLPEPSKPKNNDKSNSNDKNKNQITRPEVSAEGNYFYKFANMILLTIN